jgi:hypothetical protein
MRLAALALLFATGCLPSIRPEPDTACRLAQQARAQLWFPLPGGGGTTGYSPRDLAELAMGSPFEGKAASGYYQITTVKVLGGIAAAALISGFVMGFAVDSSQPDARNAGYGLVGGAIGIGALSLIMTATASSTTKAAARGLAAWADGCR